ncbi:hypothetical protein Syn7502_01862 [Synechococcus sp. PCC 7502]|uniref:hypothetical protein n=1 Tax=Synechococcus sp. PCC 7502 TaxID=1173263 RepID=UPI00029FF52A|nr:hypothetical protein [Synechococcus sp. PCC 7502]AFY73896.1 hypothetical protein Syn7502_01862 [Synechococcus sp. PCC 7502]
MNGDEELYCKIYIDCDLTKDQLILILADLLKGSIDLWSIETSNFIIDVMKNKDFDHLKRHDSLDGFLYYSYYLDIEPIESVASVLYKDSIGKLLETVWLKGYLAVAACDFEEELPRKGGYKWQGTLS